MPKIKRTRNNYVPHVPPEQAPYCHVPGCTEPGAYKAPKSKTSLHEYLWYCLDHIREYNQQWDFFKDMDSEAIESFRRDAVTGHRPTWNREGRIRHQYEALQDALYEFLHHGAKAPRPQPPLTAKLRKALAALDMEYPYTQRELKARYRTLVKKHHPDVNKAGKAEEDFKQITAAYAVLAEHLKNQDKR
jgi:DnaJ-domain-containing protein 1